jgi:hypothetical protein
MYKAIRSISTNTTQSETRLAGRRMGWLAALLLGLLMALPVVARAQDAPQQAAEGQAAAQISTAPIVTSTTHPDPTKIYTSVTVTLNWSEDPKVPAGAVKQYHYLFDSTSKSIPTPPDATVTKDKTLTLDNVTPGQYFFHIRSEDQSAVLSPTAHFQVNVGPTTITLGNGVINHHSPYLIEYSFTVEDVPSNKTIVLPTSFITTLCEEDGQKISPTESSVILANTAQSMQTKGMLVLDYTNSMVSSPQAIQTMEDGAKYIIDKTTTSTLLGLYEFHAEDVDPNRVAEMTTNKAYLKSRVDSIWDEYVQDYPAASRCWDAVAAALQEFGTTTSTSELRFLVFLSDGRDESSSNTPGSIVGLATQRGVRIYPIAYGTEANPTALDQIASGTGGKVVPATDVASLQAAFEEIFRTLSGRLTLRWPTLKRTTNFTPDFWITIPTPTNTKHPEATTSYTQTTVVLPKTLEGDTKEGSLSYEGSPVLNGETDLYLRANYVPRYVTQIRLRFDFGTGPAAPSFPYEIEKIPFAEGGLADNWTMTSETLDNGQHWILLSSPKPEDPKTAITYAWFGNLLRFHFTDVPNLATLLAALKTQTDDTLYLSGQHFVINIKSDPQPSMAVAPTTETATLSGRVGGPFLPTSSATYTITNTGEAPLPWRAAPDVTWLTVTPDNGVLAAANSLTVTVTANDKAVTLLKGPNPANIYFSNDVNGLGNTRRPVILTLNQTYNLDVDPTSGTVAIAPNLPYYDEGATVSLTAAPKPNSGQVFAGWSGTGVTSATWFSNPLLVTMNQPTSITAHFIPASHTVSIRVNPPTAGWTFTDSAQVTTEGVGSAILSNVPFGEVTLIWKDLAGYLPPAENPVIRTLENSLAIVGEYQLAPAKPATPKPADKRINVSVSMVLDWADSAATDTYDLYFWKSAETKPTSPTVTGLTASEWDPPMDLDGSTEYSWQVVARSAVATTEGDVWTFTTEVPPVSTTPTPTGLTASRGEYVDRIVISWTPIVTPRVFFRVYRAESVDGPRVKLGDEWTTATTFVDTTVEDATPHYYFVKAARTKWGELAGAFSASEEGFLLQSTPLPAPTGVTASDGTSTQSVSVAWTAVPDAHFYMVYRGTAADTSPTLAVTGWISALTFEDTTALPGFKYYYFVRSAWNESGLRTSDFSVSDQGWREGETPVMPAPTGVSASDEVYAEKIRVTWAAVPEAGFYQVYRSLTPTTATAQVLSPWLMVPNYDDTSAQVGLTYYYWVRCATSAAGTQLSPFSVSDSGQRLNLNEVKTYKVTYANCDLTASSTSDLTVRNTTDKASVKVTSVKAAGLSKRGVTYITTKNIPEFQVRGNLKMLYSEAPIQHLVATTGTLRTVTMKNTTARLVEVYQIGSVSMTGLKDSTGVQPAYAYTTLLIPGNAAYLDVNLSGVILDRLETGEPINRLKVATKSFRNPLNRQKAVSLAGLGRMTNADMANTTGVYEMKAAALKTLSLKGGSVLMDKIKIGQSIGTVTVRSAILNKVLYKGSLGFPTAPTRMHLLAGIINTLDAQDGVAGVFVAGYAADEAPNYSGSISKFRTNRKSGFLAGYAYVAPYLPMPTFYPSQGDLVVNPVL